MAVPKKPTSLNVQTMENKGKKLDPTVFNFMDKVKKIKKRKKALDELMANS